MLKKKWACQTVSAEKGSKVRFQKGYEKGTVGGQLLILYGLSRITLNKEY